MSKLLKSKILLGVMIFAVMFAGAVVVKTASAAECDLGTVTLKQGMSGTAVTCLQTKLGVTPMTGYFGTITKGKVMAFQSANQLVADGIVGNITKAALGMVTTSGTLPAGCTSTAGFSTTTGASCAATTTLPAGCVAGALFSSTTGQACTATATSTTLSGGAGTVDITSTSTDVEDVAIEGQDTKVLGFKIEASDSDVSVTNLKLTLENTDAPASPYRLTNYVDSVDIYMGSTKVGSVDASDFSKSGYVYTKSIALSNAVVKMGSSHKATFYVVVNAAASIDSTNMVGGAHIAKFNIDVDNVRYQDATGLVMSDSTTVSVTGVSFDSLVNAGDVKLSISKGSGNPVEGTVQISDTGSTPDIKMLEFKLKATGDDLSFDQISFATTATTTPDGPIADMIQGLEVRNGTDVLASDPVFYNVGDTEEATASAVTYVKFLLDDTYTISQDSTDTFVVYAKIADITDFTAGSLKLSLLSTGITTEDTNGDSVSNETGSATGTIQTFKATGAVVGNYSWSVSSTGTMIDFFFTVDNSAGESNFDVVTADVNDEIVAGSTAVVVEGATYISDIKGTVSKYSGDDVTSTPSTKFTVAAGDTTTFRVRYSLGSAVAVPVVSADNGKWLEIKVNSVAGETVTSSKVNSPTATVNL